MNAKLARQLAEDAIAVLTGPGDSEWVEDMTVVGLHSDGSGLYFVTDNGEEVNGLTKAEAIEIIVENLTA